TETFGGLGDEARTFLGGFVADLPRMLGELARAFEASDKAKARRAVHALKGAALSIGAQRLGQLAGDIQDCLDGDDLDTALMMNGGLAKTGSELTDAAALLGVKELEARP